jgi:hypothetical protein
LQQWVTNNNKLKYSIGGAEQKKVTVSNKIKKIAQNNIENRVDNEYTRQTKETCNNVHNKIKAPQN